MKITIYGWSTSGTMRRGTWAYGPDAHTSVDAARALAWAGRMIPATGTQ